MSPKKGSISKKERLEEAFIYKYQKVFKLVLKEESISDRNYSLQNYKISVVEMQGCLQKFFDISVNR